MFWRVLSCLGVLRHFCCQELLLQRLPLFLASLHLSGQVVRWRQAGSSSSNKGNVSVDDFVSQL